MGELIFPDILVDFDLEDYAESDKDKNRNCDDTNANSTKGSSNSNRGSHWNCSAATSTNTVHSMIHSFL